MIIHAVIVDDDDASFKAIMSALKPYTDIEVVAKAKNSNGLIEILKSQQVDFIFLDIELEGESGFDVAKYIKENYPDIEFAFLTGHASYAIDGYEFGAASFLTKPINYLKFDRTIKRISKQILEKKHDLKENELNEAKNSNAQSAKLMLKSDTGYEIVPVKDIIYIERRCRKNYLITPEGTRRIYSYTMKDLIAMLEPYNFYCSHQSYIVSLDRVKAIGDEDNQLYYLKLSGTDQKIPLSRSKYEECRQLLRGSSLYI